MPVTHKKTDSIADWTQAQLDAQIALGNYPPGTTLSQIVLPSDWNNTHNVAVGISEITATGTPSGTTYLRGDGTWSTPPGGSGTGPITFPGTATPTYTAGKLDYDTVGQNLVFYNGDPNVSMDVGRETWVRCYNNTGSTIANGAAVYITGYDATSGNPTIALAKADSGTTLVAIGLATESIPNATSGEITCIGIVHGLDTTAFAAGDTVYVSATTAGGLTNAAPVAPNFRYRIGKVGRVNATTGYIHVTPSTGDLGRGSANQILGMNAAGTGSEYKTLTAGTNITITQGTGSVTIASSGGSNTSLTEDRFTATAGQTVFTLSSLPLYVQVFVSGVFQPSNQYTLVGSTLTLATGAPLNAVVDVQKFMGLASAQTNQAEFYLQFPFIITVPLTSSSRRAYSITGLYGLKTSAGTVTFSILINGVAVTGLSGIVATTTPQTVLATALNSVNVGDRLTLAITATSGAQDFEFTYSGT